MSKILLVDDDKDMLRLTENWVKKAGFETVTALCGEEALELVKKEKPDLVILDYFMPGLDGPSVFTSLKDNEETKNIPVIFRTGADDGGIDDVIERLHPEGVAPKVEGKKCLLNAIASIL